MGLIQGNVPCIVWVLANITLMLVIGSKLGLYNALGRKNQEVLGQNFFHSCRIEVTIWSSVNVYRTSLSNGSQASLKHWDGAFE